MNCKDCQISLPDLLLDPNAPGSEGVRTHVEHCAGCANDLAELEKTFALLDSWEAPAVSPYFDQKLQVLLREEQAAPPAGWFEQWKTRLLLNTGHQFRPAMAGALAVVLLIGGSSVGLSTFSRMEPTKVETSATVKDLQILDRNAQALQALDQLLQDDPAPELSPASPQS